MGFLPSCAARRVFFVVVVRPWCKRRANRRRLVRTVLGTRHRRGARAALSIIDG